MEEKYTGIVLKSVDYQDNDKLLWLYTAEKGKITATIKGVKKPKAKLKFAAEPFCFGEYTLSVTQSRYVVIGCTLSDSFYDIRQDVEKYYCGCAIIDVIATLENESEAKPYLLVNLLKSLEKLAYSTLAGKLIVTKFLLEYLKTEGYAISFDSCNCCHTSVSRLYLDLQAGGAMCGSCKSPDAILLDGALLTALRFISNTDYEQIHTIKLKEEYLLSCLQVLNRYITSLLHKVKSLDALIALQ